MKKNNTVLDGIKKLFNLDIAKTVDSVGTATEKIISNAKGEVSSSDKAKIEKLQLEIGLKLAELSNDGMNDLRSFFLKYEGTADQIPRWLLITRSIIRPAFSLFFFLQLMVFTSIDVFRFLVDGIEFDSWILANMPQAWWWLAGIVLTFWFGGKIGENIVEKIKEKK